VTRRRQPRARALTRGSFSSLHFLKRSLAMALPAPMSLDSSLADSRSVSMASLPGPPTPTTAVGDGERTNGHQAPKGEKDYSSSNAGDDYSNGGKQPKVLRSLLFPVPSSRRAFGAGWLGHAASCAPRAGASLALKARRHSAVSSDFGTGFSALFPTFSWLAVEHDAEHALFVVPRGSSSTKSTLAACLSILVGRTCRTVSARLERLPLSS
jgi:hypothetical protein